MNRIAVGQRAGQCLDQQSDVAFGGDQTAGVLVEGAGFPFGYRLRRREQHQRIALQIGSAADDGHVDRSGLQRPRPHQQGEDRRGASRVHDDARPVEPESAGNELRSAADGSIEIRIRGAMVVFPPRLCDQRANDLFALGPGKRAARLQLVKILGDLLDIHRIRQIPRHPAAAGVAEIDARVAGRLPERIVARIEKSVVRQGVHVPMRFVVIVEDLGREGSSSRIERNLGASSAHGGVGLAPDSHARIVKQLAVEDLLGQDAGRIAARFDQPPILVQIRGARKPARHADDRQRSFRKSLMSHNVAFRNKSIPKKPRQLGEVFGIAVNDHSGVDQSLFPGQFALR